MNCNVLAGGTEVQVAKVLADIIASKMRYRCCLCLSVMRQDLATCSFSGGVTGENALLMCRKSGCAI